MSEEDAPAAGDPLGTAAIVVGCIGIVVAGVVFAIITAVLAAYAGAQAKAQNRSLFNAYAGFVLAAVDGLVWLVLQMMFELPFLVG